MVEINDRIVPLSITARGADAKIQLSLYPRNEVEGGYTGFTLFVRPSVCLSVRPSVRPWVGVRMITLILFSGFKFFFYIYHLGQDLAWD